MNKRTKLIVIAAAAIVALLVFLVLGFALNIFHEHEWEDATCTDPKSCIYCNATRGKALGHDYVYGKCTECSNISRSTKRELEDVAQNVATAYWILNYEVSPDVEDFNVEFTKIDNKGSRYYLTGTISADYQGDTYSSEFTLTCNWNESSNKFVRESNSFDTFYKVDSNGRVVTSKFSTTTTFARLKYGTYGLAIARFTFMSNGDCKQDIFDSYGIYHGNTSKATYVTYKTPSYYEIHATSIRNGNVMILKQYEGYLKTSNGEIYYLE